MSEIAINKRRVTDLVDLIGNTPVVEIRYMRPNPKVRIWAKLEGLNPGGSVKDRICKAMVEAAEREALLDDKLMLEDAEAFRVARELARVEGLFVGISSGAAMWGAMQVASRINEGTLVVIFPDGGEKYMSTPLFDLPVGSMLPEIL